MSKKFPRIPHLPWSPGPKRDDLVLKNCYLSNFIGICNRIVITEKLDGSNVCLTRDDVFARSHSGSPKHPSFDMIKSYHASIKYDVEEGYSLFGEWCFAVHSIKYEFPCLPFFMFGIRDDEKGDWLSWDVVEETARAFKFQTVPVLFDGIVEDKFEELIKTLTIGPSTFGEEKEGIVAWPYYGLGADEDFSQCTAKWVKEDHPKDKDIHWMTRPIEKQIINDK